jgi:hypothetical protein
MKHQIDEKGKVFTDYVSKDPIQVIVQTATNRIYGTFHVSHENRLKDELRSGLFLAITEAVIFDRSGEVEESVCFSGIASRFDYLAHAQAEIQPHGQVVLGVK